MGWKVVPHPSGGYTVRNAVTGRTPGPAGTKAARFPSQAAALAMVAAINVAWKSQPEAQRRRREAAAAAAATRRRNRQPARRRHRAQGRRRR